MKHGIVGKKFSRSSGHRIAMSKNLMRSIVEFGSIVTTITKAKFIRPKVEKLITIAKDSENSLSAKKKLFSVLQSAKLVSKITELAKRNDKRNGGYSRIVKLGFRSGDKATTAVIEIL